jgi:Phosphotransferase enzyme family
MDGHEDGALIEIDQVTPELLTSVLSREGVLSAGRVVGISPETNSTIVSIIHRLRVDYSEGAPAGAPRRLFLKISKPETDRDDVRREVSFYQSVVPVMPECPVLRCFGAGFSEESGRGYVLLEDLSKTHVRPPWPLPPETVDCEGAVDCLSWLHAFWWGHSRLGREVGHLPSEAELWASAERDRDAFRRFREFLGDRLSERRRVIFERVLAASPVLRRRLAGPANLTLIHGDAHGWNFLFPVDRAGETTRILDWHTWQIDLGATDLAYLMAVHWYPERRQRLERALLDRYHSGLVARGVPDYDREACWQDYRLAVIDCLLLPMRQWNDGLPPLIWWSHLERIACAFEDLACEELVGR